MSPAGAASARPLRTARGDAVMPPGTTGKRRGGAGPGMRVAMPGRAHGRCGRPGRSRFGQRGWPAHARFGRPSRGLSALAALATIMVGCAREAPPPGGPRDQLPPIVVSSEPDTFSTVEPFRSPVTLRFSERIRERPSAGTLDQAVIVSPVSGEVRVSHSREGLDVRVLGGFEAGRVYRLTVRPVILDMFNNPLQEPYELFFSTGPEFTANVVAGSVVDRLTGDRLPDARVDATVEGSDVIHTGVTDDAGIFALRYLPAGEYVVSAYLDRNRNGEPDFTEPQGTRPAPLNGGAETVDTVIVLDVALLPNDTTAARVARVTVEDSISLSVSLDDYLDPEIPLDDVRVAITSDSVDGPEVVAVLHEHEAEAHRRAVADSIAQVRAAQDSVARAQAGADSVSGAEADSAAPVRPEALRGRRGAVAGREAAGTGGAEPERPRPGQTMIVMLDGVLVPEVVYEADISGITNINGVKGGGGTAAFTRPVPEEEADSVAVGDTLGAVADTTAAGRDTIPVVADSVAVGDTLGAVADTTAAGRDTIPAAADSVAVGDTLGAVADSASEAPDTAASLDTLSEAPDSVAVGDTLGAASDTTAARDAIPATPADSVAPGDTLAAPADTTAARDTIPIP